MKTKKIFWATLSMTAALMMTACSSDDNMVDAPVVPETPEAPASVTIPYTVTVNDGATNRAAVDSDMKTLRFATGDKLYIMGTNVKGILDIQTGVGETSGATFSGDLTISGGGTPASDLSLTATLVSAQQTEGSEISVSDAGAVTVNYPDNAYCADVATAVQKYSRLTGESTYAAKSFTLTQNTAFLNFEITFEDGTAAGTNLSAVVSNGGSALCTANVTTVTDGGVKAKFVLPVASSGTTLSSANVKMGDKEAISFGSDGKALEGKVYNVKRTQAVTSYTLAESEVGMIVGTDGKAYAVADKDNLPTGVTAVAMVAYKSGTNGLAIQLNSSPEDKSQTDAETYAGGLNTSLAIPGGTWRLPSKDDWQNMFLGCAVSGDASSASNDMGPIAGFKAKIAATGTTWKSGLYWSSTDDGSKAWDVDFRLDGGDAYVIFYKVDPSYSRYALGCLAF